MSKLLRELADRYKKKVKKKLNGDITKALNYTRDEMYDEAVNMFNSFIDQFYSYETKVYIRHGEVFPGTGHGTNLYRGRQIRKVGTTYNPKLSVEFSGVRMEGGYQHDTPEEVLNYVMSGIRFPIHGAEMTWSGQYAGKYFSYTGVPEQAFEYFGQNYNKIGLEIFYEKWHEFGW